jgi:hypothetical protein
VTVEELMQILDGYDGTAVVQLYESGWGCAQDFEGWVSVADSEGNRRIVLGTVNP